MKVLILQITSFFYFVASVPAVTFSTPIISLLLNGEPAACPMISIQGGSFFNWHSQSLTRSQTPVKREQLSEEDLKKLQQMQRDEDPDRPSGEAEKQAPERQHKQKQKKEPVVTNTNRNGGRYEPNKNPPPPPSLPPPAAVPPTRASRSISYVISLFLFIGVGLIALTWMGKKIYDAIRKR